jgi:hypothetical protein
MIMNEHYLVTFEQKLVRKEVAIWDRDVQKEQLLASQVCKRSWKEASTSCKMSSVRGKITKKGSMNNGP